MLEDDYEDTLEESYEKNQDACNFVKGEMVTVRFKVGNKSGGWDNVWADEMDSFIGGTYPVHTVEEGSVGISLMHPIHEDNFSFPYFVLQREKGRGKDKVIITCGSIVEEVLFSKELLAEMKAGNKLILNTVGV